MTRTPRESEAPARCRCGHDASQHYADSEARGRPCRECGCLGMESCEAQAREGIECDACHGAAHTDTSPCEKCGGTGFSQWGRTPPVANCGHKGEDGCCMHPGTNSAECHQGVACPAREGSNA